VEGQEEIPPKLVIIEGKEVQSEKNTKQKGSMKKEEVPSIIEGIYSRKRYMEK